LAGLAPEEGKVAYKQLLQSLASGQGGGIGPLPGLPPQVVQMLEQLARFKEKNQFTVDDIFGLAVAAPRGLDKDALARLGQITRVALETGQGVENLVARLKVETANPSRRAALTLRQAVVVLVAAGEAGEAVCFLPT